MSTWVPGCLVTSADGSVTVTTAPGGGSNLSGVGSSQLDTNAYTIPTGTYNTTVSIPFVKVGTVTYTLIKGATYVLSMSFAAQLPNLPGTTTAANFGVAMGLGFPAGGTGTTLASLAAVNYTLALTPGNVLSAPAQLMTGVATYTFTVPTTWGPSAGSAGYSPVTISGCTLLPSIYVNGPAAANTAFTTTSVWSAGSSVEPAASGGSPITITRIK